jgi:hypothetical protein
MKKNGSSPKTVELKFINFLFIVFLYDIGNLGVKKFQIISVKKSPLFEGWRKFLLEIQTKLSAQVLEILGNYLKF